MTNQIKSVAAKIGFKSKRIIKKEPLRNDFICVGKYRDKDVLFKITSNKNKKIVELMKKEAAVDSILNKSVSKISVPRILLFGRNKNFSWIIREYIEGKSLSSDMKAYDNINHDFSNKTEIVLLKIIKIIRSFQDLKINPKLKSLGVRFDPKIEHLISPKLIQNIGLDVDKLVKFYNSFRREYLSKKNLRVIMGDFNPGNLIINQKKNYQVYISDLSWVCLDNYLMDVTYFWFFLWRLPSWQNFLLEQFIKNNNDKKNFQACVIRQGLSFGWQDDKMIKNPIHLSRHKAWRRYIKAAGDSFDKITTL